MNEKILLVDDELDIINFISPYLENIKLYIYNHLSLILQDFLITIIATTPLLHHFSQKCHFISKCTFLNVTI
jgi:hypothetical protein